LPTGKHGLPILRIGSYEKIQILRRPRLGMDRQSIAANDQIFNAPFVEGEQEFFEVLAEHRAFVPSMHIASTIDPTRHPAARAPATPAIRGIRHP
jgi:hypothetical protein